MRYAEYVEKKRHGSPKFPLQYYYVDKTHPQYVMQAHWHKEFEIIRISEGELTLYLNNTPKKAKKGDILFLGCRTLHRAIPKKCIYECIVFDLNMLLRQSGDLVEKYILPIISSEVEIDCHMEESDGAFYSAASSLFHLMGEKRSAKELEIFGILFQIFAFLYDKNYILPKEEIFHSRTEKAITKTIRYIQEHFHTPITLEKLSEVSGLDKKYLCRIFKEYTSKTPITYVNELRIENACNEMTLNKKSITQAAFDSGFNDSSYFSKTFRAYKKMSPKEYKKAFIEK